MMMMMMMMMMMTTILRGWQPVSTGFYKACRSPQIDVSSSRAGASKGPEGEPHDGRQNEASPHRPRADTPLPLPRVEPFLRRNPFQRPARAAGSKPRRRGR